VRERKPGKLHLNKETLRVLSGRLLAGVMGGAATSTSDTDKGGQGGGTWEKCTQKKLDSCWEMTQPSVGCPADTERCGGDNYKTPSPLPIFTGPVMLYGQGH
jgi:hypothetical protein